MVFSANDIERMSNEFDALLLSTKREGIISLLDWLKTTDFYTAPSSTKYHGNYRGGLLAHSLNVYKVAKNLKELYTGMAMAEKNIGSIPEDSLIIACLLHDLCKVNFYKESAKYFKDANGEWVQYMGYEIDEHFPVGHGEKSVIMLQNFIKLSGQEVCAIRWHMGMSDPGVYISTYEQKPFKNALEIVPLVLILMEADMTASYFMEKTVDVKENVYNLK